MAWIMVKKYLIVVFLILNIILTGCGDVRILERLGITQITSYDYLPDEEESDNKLLVSIAMPRVNPENGEIKREVLTTKSKTSKEARIKLAQKTELKVVSGQLRVALFGLSLSKNGVWEHIDTLMRDPAISQRVKVAVVNGNANDMLKKDYSSHPRTGQYIDLLLEKETKAQNIPEVSLYEFSRDLLDDGIDPVAPILKQKEKSIIIDGIGLFKNDKYITKIKPEKVLIFSILSDTIKGGETSIDLGEIGRENENVMFSSLISKRDIKVKSNVKQNRFTVNINIEIKGSVLEYIGDLKINKDKDRKELEKLISEYFSKETKEMIETMKEHRVDSVGLGKYVRNSLPYNEWKKLKWDEVYSDLEVNCNAKIKIKDYGKWFY
jgi:spore germination protein